MNVYQAEEVLNSTSANEVRESIPDALKGQVGKECDSPSRENSV